MAVSVATLTKAVTVDEAKTFVYNVLAYLGVSTTNWKPGAVVRTIIAAAAIWVSALSYIMAHVAKMGLLDYAEGDWLTLVASSFYETDRIEATFAAGEITMINASGGVYVIAVDDLVFSNPTTGKTYRNTTAFTLNALETKTVPIDADEAGSASTSAPGTITRLETGLNGVTCTNAASLVGSDAETDPDLRTRAKQAPASVSPNGPSDAYAYLAKNAKTSGGAGAGVTRVTVAKDGFGNVTVYCATASGGITGTTGDTSTPLGAVHDAIQRSVAPLCVTPTAVSATPLSIPVTYEVQMYNTSGLTEAEIKTAIASSLTTFMSTEPIGGNAYAGPGKVFLTAIQTAIGATKDAKGVQLPIFRVILAAPAADVAVAANEVPVLGTVTCTAVRQVTPGNL